MRQTFAVLVKQKPMTYFSTRGPHPDKAFIVEAETARKAENQVKRSNEGQRVEVLGAIPAEQFKI